MTHVVEIVISGGAVQHVNAPKGIRVIVRDYDIEGSEDDEEFDIRTDKNGGKFQQIEFPQD